MKIRKIVTLISSIIVVVAITAVFGNEFTKLKNELTSLEEELELAQAENNFFQSENKIMHYNMESLITKRAEDKDYFKETLETERIRAFIQYQSSDNEEGTPVAGYLMWEQANELADHFYEDSDGRFKREWGQFLALEAFEKDIDPFLIYELLRVETGGRFDPNVVGPETRYGHAYGLAQFMKNTSPWIAEMADLPYDHDMLFDPLYSIQLAVTYLDFLHNQYGDWDHALTAYHRGMYGLQNYIAQHGNARSWYAVEIQEKAQAQAILAADYEGSSLVTSH
ncbi:soluble lytic murein transglycosylase-like protein [Evansella vedderi]|uniref:Soluble lytic murein transglycosylase-like protein n=1 Tax=Evansella vedderi TaxID=38282 RepID=A0ABT9ZPC2_9BACI|nr:transglycosylase SLT domain-containing protein [Evansella vedderi]MDQ0253087.1 soluble lytic murein transglycosylase-like protein [Evansella vedderi]